MREHLTRIAELFWRRRANPWNWLLQSLSLVLLTLGLWAHSIGLLVLAALFFAGGWFHLGIQPMRQSGLAWLGYFISRAIRWETAWRQTTKSKVRARWAALWAVLGLILGITLWMGELAGPLFVLGAVVLVRVAINNRASGIDP